jgi:hypothetical protein
LPKDTIPTPPIRIHSRASASLRRTLESYGILTRDRLREAAHAGVWGVPFKRVLARAVRAGRIRRLSRDLYEPGPKR